MEVTEIKITTYIVQKIVGYVVCMVKEDDFLEKTWAATHLQSYFHGQDVSVGDVFDYYFYGEDDSRNRYYLNTEKTQKAKEYYKKIFKNEMYIYEYNYDEYMEMENQLNVEDSIQNLYAEQVPKEEKKLYKRIMNIDEKIFTRTHKKFLKREKAHIKQLNKMVKDFLESQNNKKLNKN